MSTPNDNRAGFGVEAKAGSLNQPVKGKIGQPRPATQPQPPQGDFALRAGRYASLLYACQVGSEAGTREHIKRTAKRLFQ